MTHIIELGSVARVALADVYGPEYEKLMAPATVARAGADRRPNVYRHAVVSEHERYGVSWIEAHLRVSPTQIARGLFGEAMWVTAFERESELGDEPHWRDILLYATVGEKASEVRDVWLYIDHYSRDLPTTWRTWAKVEPPSLWMPTTDVRKLAIELRAALYASEGREAS